MSTLTTTISPFRVFPLAATVQYASWFAGLAISMAMLLAPALWNGFPIVFFDTGGYVGRVIEMTLAPGRSFFYGIFLWMTSLGWWTLWGPVAIQALFTIWLIHLMLRCHRLPAGPVATTLISAVLSLATGISWYTAQLMPDVLVSLVVIALWLLGFRWQKLVRAERFLLIAIALLGMLSHMSCMALGIGLALVVLFAKVAVNRWNWSLSVRALPPVATVAAAMILMPLLHLALVGKPVYTPGGPAFIFGRLVQDGTAQRYLAEHCPIPGVKLCALQDRLPNTADDFLWGNSPFNEIGGWGGADAELTHLVNACFKTYPGAVAWHSLLFTVRQMVMVATGDGLDEFHDCTRGVFSILPPPVTRQFNEARQQQEDITQPLFDALNLVHVPVAQLSMLGLLLVIGWGLHARRHDLAGVAVFTLLALLGNAFICGALSNPHDRYQSRLVWLATLIVAMTMVSWWQARAGKRH
jgi:hypothetical protein